MHATHTLLKRQLWVVDSETLTVSQEEVEIKPRQVQYLWYGLSMTINGRWSTAFESETKAQSYSRNLWEHANPAFQVRLILKTSCDPTVVPGASHDAWVFPDEKSVKIDRGSSPLVKLSLEDIELLKKETVTLFLHRCDEVSDMTPGLYTVEVVQ